MTKVLALLESDVELQDRDLRDIVDALSTAWDDVTLVNLPEEGEIEEP